MTASGGAGGGPDPAGEYELIASKNSYYSAKVRACLQYKRIPYREVGASGDTIRRAIRLTGSHFYPVVVCPDGTALQDSCDIVEALEARHPARPVLPADPVQRLVATLIETVADDFMALSGVPFRWVPADTRAWAERMFVQICGERMADVERRRAARENALRIAGSIGGRFGDAWQGALGPLQRICVATLDRLDEHLRDTPFLLGERPSLADLGMMNAVYGHLYRDPGVISDHIRWRCIALALWVDHMLAAAGESDRGELRLVASLEPVLASFAEPYAPLAEATLEAADALLPALAPGSAPEAVLRPAAARLHPGGVPLAARSYVAWKLQRLAERYRAVPDAARPEADRWMRAAGFLEVCRHRPRWRLEKTRLALRKAPAGSIDT